MGNKKEFFGVKSFLSFFLLVAVSYSETVHLNTNVPFNQLIPLKRFVFLAINVKVPGGINLKLRLSSSYPSEFYLHSMNYTMASNFDLLNSPQVVCSDKGLSIKANNGEMVQLRSLSVFSVRRDISMNPIEIDEELKIFTSGVFYTFIMICTPYTNLIMNKVDGSIEFVNPDHFPFSGEKYFEDRLTKYHPICYLILLLLWSISRLSKPSSIYHKILTSILVIKSLPFLIHLLGRGDSHLIFPILLRSSYYVLLLSFIYLLSSGIRFVEYKISFDKLVGIFIINIFYLMLLGMNWHYHHKELLDPPSEIVKNVFNLVFKLYNAFLAIYFFVRLDGQVQYFKYNNFIDNLRIYKKISNVLLLGILLLIIYIACSVYAYLDSNKDKHWYFDSALHIYYDSVFFALTALFLIIFLELELKKPERKHEDGIIVNLDKSEGHAVLELTEN